MMKRMKTGLNLVLIAFICLFTGVVSAEVKLDLNDAIKRALNHDPRIDEKESFVTQAKGLLDEAKGSGGFRYSVDSFLAIATGVDGGFYEDGADSCSGDCTPRDDIYDIDDGYSLWGGLTFSIVKPIGTFGRLENYQRAATHNIVIKQQDVEIQRDSTRLDVVRAYFGFLTARDSRLLLEDTRKRLNGALELVNEWLDEGNGKASQTNRYALEAGLGLIDSKMTEATVLEKIAMDGLKLLTGLQSETVVIADRRLKPVALPDREIEEWIELAQQNRPEFKQVEAGLVARRALVEATRANEKPIVFAGVAGSLAYAPGRDTIDNPHVYDPFNHVGVSPLIGLRWQWEQGAQPARVAQAQAELDALVHKASFARQGIPFQVREQHSRMHAKYESMLAMKSSAKSARRWMIAAYTDFEAGLEEADKILTAMQVYVLAYAEYLLIVNDYNNLVSKLQSVSGVYE